MNKSYPNSVLYASICVGIHRKLSRLSALTKSISVLAIISILATCSSEPPARITPSSIANTTSYALQNRPDVRGLTGAVSADHPLAAQAGLSVLQRGGNATDAVIAMAGVLAVVRPHMNGIGGDAFGIFYDGESGEVTALNASGRTGALATPEFFLDAGLNRVPGSGAKSVSVPGAVAGWVDAHERFGSLEFSSLLSPGIAYAEHGFPVSTRLAQDFEEQGGSLNVSGRMLYLPGGSAPEVGSLLINPPLADSLSTIAEHGKRGYYQGDIAQKLADFIASEGGHLRAEDFAAHSSTWVEPIRNDYLGHTFIVMPPNTQGVAQLALMELSKSHPIESLPHNSSAYFHQLIELKKIAFADRDRWIADPAHSKIPVDELLDPAYLRERAALLDVSRAAELVEPGFGNEMFSVADSARWQHDRNDSGDTVYLTAVDQWGNAVSWIQSNYAGFGSGLLEPSTGILLHNRGTSFTLQPGHPNQVAPHKRPYHTLSPMMALHPDGGFAFTMGTPGGDSQTQSLLQIVNNMLIFKMTPQQAIEAPRFRSSNGLSVAIENRVSAQTLNDLASLGHQLQIVEGWTATFGGAQMIVRDAETGVLTAAADPRREAYALAY